ncbi:MAG: MmgE/PrpD family protein, partial [Hyphomicrobiales bacterium]|nr:MmgE/PrpD family protein [Hyphomicrobiales bacterium]
MTQASTPTIAETLADWLASANINALSSETREISRRIVLDVAGLCIAARNETYVQATISASGPGDVTAIGHARGFDAFSAALINGTAAHGEDYDDTFEGGPVHSGAVVVSAAMAICEAEGLSGERLLLATAHGAELLCRLSLVTPKAIHKAGFHPTAVFGTMAAAGAVSVALGLTKAQTVHALGIAGSMASGIIEYLAEGTWTKRMHAGWAAQSGIRAALMARGGFLGPRTVFEGTHGFFHAFAPSRKPDFVALLAELGTRWVIDDIAFKPFACGTMTQPFIDCAIALAAEGVRAEDIVEITCDVGEGTVHRLWEPLAVKHRPQTPYAAKFSTPFCMAIGFLDGKAGLGQFSEARIADRQAQELAAKIRYVINPNDPYPDNFIGHLKATLKNGETRVLMQDHMRGGAHAPMSLAEVETKFIDNAVYGGWNADAAQAARSSLRALFDRAD